MKKVRLLPFILALSLPISGCSIKDGFNSTKTWVEDKVIDPVKDFFTGGGKDEEKSGGDVTPEPTPTPTPTPTPDPTPDPTPGPEDPLTPAQRASANGIKATIDGVLSFMYEDGVIEECDEYTLAYAEEIALEGVSYDVVVSSLMDAMSLAEDSSPEAIIEFVINLKEQAKLKDVLYTGVAVGKSLLRAEAKNSEEHESELTYVADYLDKEGAKIHSSIYGILDSSLDFVESFADEEFLTSVLSIYDSETNQISFEALSTVMIHVGSAVLKFVSIESDVQYLASVVVDGALSFIKEFKLLDEETIESIESLDYASAIEQVFSYIGLGGSLLQYLASEESPVAYVVELVNLALKGEYEALLEKVLNDYFELIEVEVTYDMFADEYRSIIGIVAGLVASFETEEFNAKVSAVVDEEGVVDISKIKELVLAVEANLEGLAPAEEHLLALGEMYVAVAKQHLLVVEGKTQEEVDEIFAEFDVSEIIAGAFDTYEDVLDFLKALGDSESDEFATEYEAIKSVIEAVQSGDTMAIAFAAINAVGDILYAGKLNITYTDVDTFKSNLFGVVLSGYVLYTYTTSDLSDLFNAMIVVDELFGDKILSEEGVKTFLNEGIYTVVSALATSVDYLDVVINVFGEAAESLCEEEFPVIEEIVAALREAQTSLNEVADFLSNESSLEEYMPVILYYGNLVLEALTLRDQLYEKGVVDSYLLADFLTKVASLVLEVETVEFDYSDYESADERVKAAIGELVIEEGATTQLNGRCYYVEEPFEEDGVYYVEVTLVSNFAISYVEGNLESFAASGSIVKVAIPSLEDIENLFQVETSVAEDAVNP